MGGWFVEWSFWFGLGCAVVDEGVFEISLRKMKGKRDMDLLRSN